MLFSLEPLKHTIYHSDHILNKIIHFNYFPRIKFLNQVACKHNKSFSKKEIVNLSYVSYEETEESTKPPIFIFHGVIGSKRQWENFGKTILNKTHRKVVAVDLRNHGESPHTQSHKYTDQARDVIKLFKILNAQQASLIGHSMGGRTAMCVALMAPQKVTGLQVIDISPMSTPLHFKKFLPRILLAMKGIEFCSPKRISAARAEARRQLSGIVRDDYLLKIILANIKRNLDGTVGWACNLDGLIRDYRYWVSFPNVTPGVTYGGPTLFIGGQLSEFIPPGELDYIKALFPEATLKHIPKAGHYVQFDDPETFLDLTISFLNNQKYRTPSHVPKQQ